MRKFKIKRNHAVHSHNAAAFSKYLDEPLVALSFLVLGLVALLLSVINFFQAVYLY